ncbi:MAG: WecB/TagA/CpsF family glycosyltransferase [Bacillota bacterium]
MANILGINIDGKGKAEALSAISAFYLSGNSHLIVTPNPEIILSADEDEELFYILNQAELSLADGFGLQIAALLSRQPLSRLTGADLLPELLQDAENNNRKVLVINRRDGLSSAQDILSALHKRFPNLQATVLDIDRKDHPSQKEATLIKEQEPDLAICTFGAPFQEKYLFHLRAALGKLPVSAGLGGAFDFLTGRVSRAPLIFRRLGIEWLWRLIQQPSRLKRIYRATVVFGWQLIRWLYILPNKYRPNVAILLFKQESGEKFIFTVERQGEPGHWQLPQGGLDDLSLEQAGEKELREESGASSFSIIASLPDLYKYDFDKESGKYANPRKQRHFGYKGQAQGLLICRFNGEDGEFNIKHWDHMAWRWVKESELVASLHPCRREAAAIYLNKLKEVKL